MPEWPYEIMVLPLDRMFADPRYQRPVTSLANQIAEDFNPLLLGTLTGSLRKKPKGEFSAENLGKASVALIDGQQRWTGAKLSKAEVPVLPVVVYVGLSLSDEAYIFAMMQKARRQMTSYERLNAMVVAADRFPAQAAIFDAVEQAGFSLGSKQAAKGKDTVIYAAAALERVYAWGAGANHGSLDGGEVEAGRTTVLQVLTVLKNGFPSRPEGYLSGDIIRGLGNFLTREYEVAIDLERLVRKLQRTTPEKLRARANEYRGSASAGGSAAKYLADAIFTVYSR